MDYIRVIPCLDFKDGRVVKGVKFENVADAGDPVECAVLYEKEGADELTFLDISATVEGKKTVVDAVRRVCEKIKIPLAVGGGIKSADDACRIIGAGASKVGINSAAIVRPEVISDCADAIGSKSVVSAIDAAKRPDGGWNVYRNAGMIDTGIDAVEWAVKVVKLGAGEILLTSIDRDGVKNGFDIELTRAVSQAVKVPVTASGGAGKKEHFLDAVKKGGASAVLAASLFHFRELTVSELKEYLKANGVKVK